jgi:hypothetical protein
MKIRDLKIEAEILNNWKVRIAVLTAILSPAIAATGAFYSLKSEMAQAVEKVKEQAEAKYVTRESFQDLKGDVTDVKEGVRRIEDILLKRPR